MSQPLIGSEDPVWVVPVDAAFFGSDLIFIPTTEEIGGIFQMQPRCGWEPIEDEE